MEKYLQETIEHYNLRAKEYDDAYRGSKRDVDYANFIELLSGKNILDLGCGPGSDAKHFSENGFDVAAIDLSVEFLKMAKENAPRATFIKMNIQNPEFEPESFDGLWCNLVLQHQKRSDHLLILKKFHGLLKNNGLLFINTFAGEGEFTHYSKHSQKNRLFVRYAQEDLKKILQHSDFVVQKIEKYNDGESDMIKVFAIKQ